MVRETRHKTGPDDSSARVRNAFAGRPVNERELNDAVCALVDELKRQGAQVERIIVHIKRLAEAANEGTASAMPSLGSSPDARRRVVDGAVKCCIERYYQT